MNDNKYIIILFNGFSSTKLWWEYEYEDKPILRKLNFLNKLKQIGKTYTFNQNFFNIDYYGGSEDKKTRTMWKKSSQDRIKYYDDKLYIPTIFFRAYSTNPKDYQNDWNKYIMKEKKLFEKDKNMKEYIIMNDAEHFIWNNQEYSDKIIDSIKQLL